VPGLGQQQPLPRERADRHRRERAERVPGRHEHPERVEPDEPGGYLRRGQLRPAQPDVQPAPDELAILARYPRLDLMDGQVRVPVLDFAQDPRHRFIAGVDGPGA
jgi:hypothetical protein